MSTLFISDLHLDPANPQMQHLFVTLLQSLSNEVQNLYILGDLFEVWLGDDDLSDFNQHVIAALQQSSAAGVNIYVLHGNRDFLLGTQFAKMAGIQLLPDPSIIDLYGIKTLVSHGDLLCTDDHRYQRYRRIMHHPVTQWLLRHSPLSFRRQLAQKLRQASRQQPSRHTDIMDVNLAMVKAWLQQHKCQQLIHGHTHRPAIQRLWHQQQWLSRYVLSDWHQQGNGLLVNKQNEYRLVNFQGGKTLLCY